MTMPVDTTYMDGPEPELTDEELAALRARLAQAEAQPQPQRVEKTPKVAIPRRHLPRKLAYVTFSLDGWDGEFTLPSRNLLNQREQKGLRSGDETVLREIFKDAFESLLDMTDDEIIALMDAWGEASGVTMGESNAA